MKEFKLITERCILRRLSHEDEEHIWIAAHTPGFTDGMTWDPPKDKEEIRMFTDTALKEWAEGTKYIWTIEDKNDRRFIGRIELQRKKEEPGNVWALGYFIHPQEQKKGYATEASMGALRFAFAELGVDSIVSSHADWNTASGNVLQKIGMKNVGISVGRRMKHGKPVRSIEFRMDRKDWNPRRAI